MRDFEVRCAPGDQLVVGGVKFWFVVEKMF
jgi:hypothetical protein